MTAKLDPIAASHALHAAMQQWRRDIHQHPGAYIWIGNGDATESRALHNPYYDFNDTILPLGASYWVRLVQHLCR